MAKLVNNKGKPRLFVMESQPYLKGTETVKQLSIREPNDSRLGVYMFATLVSEDETKQHPIFDYFARGKRVRVTFEIIDEDTPQAPTPEPTKETSIRVMQPGEKYEPTEEELAKAQAQLEKDHAEGNIVYDGAQEQPGIRTIHDVPKLTKQFGNEHTKKQAEIDAAYAQKKEQDSDV